MTSLLALALCLSLMASCSWLGRGHPPARERLFAGAENALSFEREIVRMEQLAKGPPALLATKEAHLRLAILYSHPQNPQPQYPAALEALQAYHGCPVSSTFDEAAEYLLTVLRQIVEAQTAIQDQKAGAEALGHSRQKIEQENRKLRDENQKLAEENRKMKEAIEKLKNLDLMLEKQKYKGR